MSSFRSELGDVVGPVLSFLKSSAVMSANNFFSFRKTGVPGLRGPAFGGCCNGKKRGIKGSRVAVGRGVCSRTGATTSLVERTVCRRRLKVVVKIE